MGGKKNNTYFVIHIEYSYISKVNTQQIIMVNTQRYLTNNKYKIITTKFAYSSIQRIDIQRTARKQE